MAKAKKAAAKSAAASKSANKSKNAKKPAAAKSAKAPAKAKAKAAKKAVKPVSVAKVKAKKGNGKAARADKVTVKEKVDFSPSEVLATVAPVEEIVLTDAEGRRYCRSSECDQIAAVDGYCRYHYLLFWKKIQVRKKILSDGKLQRYIEELTARYTDKFIELLRKDLRTEKDFMAAIQELELDGGSDSSEEDESKSYIEDFGGVPASESREDDY